MAQVQVRIPEKMLQDLDKWIEEGRFRSRSDAIKTIVAFYQEKEKIREFYNLLEERSNEAKNEPEKLIPFKE